VRTATERTKPLGRIAAGIESITVENWPPRPRTPISCECNAEDYPAQDPRKLLELAVWYRAFTERGCAPWVREAGCKPDDLERYAALLETGIGGGVMRAFAAEGDAHSAAT
jgi:hypothetical protein